MDSAGGSGLQALKAPPSKAPAATPRAVTLLAVVHGWKPDAERWLLSVFTHCKADFEALIVDNSGDTQIGAWLEGRAAERFRSVKLDPPLGFAGAVNAGIEAAAGEVVVLFDPGVELKGDAVSPLIDALADPSVVVAGPYGLRGQGTMKEFAESSGPDVDAIIRSGAARSPFVRIWMMLTMRSGIIEKNQCVVHFTREIALTSSGETLSQTRRWLRRRAPPRRRWETGMIGSKGICRR